MDGNIITQLARILIYRNEFYIETADSHDGSGGTDDTIRKANEKMVKLAVKHLTAFISKKGFCDQYQDVGTIKKAIFRKSESIIIDNFSKVISVDKVLINFIFKDWDLDSTKSFKDTSGKSARPIWRGFILSRPSVRLILEAAPAVSRLRLRCGRTEVSVQ